MKQRGGADCSACALGSRIAAHNAPSQPQAPPRPALPRDTHAQAHTARPAKLATPEASHLAPDHAGPGCSNVGWEKARSCVCVEPGALAPHPGAPAAAPLPAARSAKAGASQLAPPPSRVALAAPSSCERSQTFVFTGLGSCHQASRPPQTTPPHERSVRTPRDGAN